MQYPSHSPVTLAFGASSPPYSLSDTHKGVDFAYMPDNKVYAPFSGQVTTKAMNGRDGNAIYMSNGNQLHGLLHLSEFLVGSGQVVTQGQVIGIMGQTGAAEGIHLHWAVKVNGVFIDPLTLVKESNLAVITTEMAVALSIGTQGTQPQNADQTKWIGRTDQGSFDGMITQYSQLGQGYQATLKAEIDRLNSVIKDLGGESKELPPGKYVVTK